MNYVLDSNIFDYFLDNIVPTKVIISKGAIYVTNVQLSEISNVPNIKRRQALEKLIEAINPTKMFLESGVWIDELKWDDEQPWKDNISNDCQNLLGDTVNLPWKDALIGEVTKSNNFILVTNDNKFANRAKRNGIEVLDAASFLNLSG